MIDIQKAKQELKKHVEGQKIDNPRVANKLDHILRVSEISKKLAMELNLAEEKIQLAQLIGLLHDIGRFEQYKISDITKKFNHGEAGVELLKKDNYIRKYIEENKYDEIIYTAVYEHNRYKLTPRTNRRERVVL
ncbi:MAG: HD domain-containing protein [Clostridia bacterium]|nr:HD domain-containing protein [Clostridia bacterium]